MMKARQYIPLLLDNLIWILLLGVVILFSFLTSRFLTPINIWNILEHAAALGILVIGQSFTFISGNFDLSAESTLALCALIGTWLVAPAGPTTNGLGWELHPFLAVAVMLLVGLAIGWLNGFLITRAKMNNFIVTLAMLIILRGLIMVMTKGKTVAQFPPLFSALGHDYLGPIPASVIVLILAFIIAHIVTQYRPFGRDLYAVGGNREAALASGVDPDRRIRHAYLISGGLAAFAGWIMAGRVGAVPPTLAQGMIFEVQAAAVIGGVSLFGGRGTMVGAFGGVLLLSAIDSGLKLMRVSSFWIDTIRGLTILIAMLIDAQKVRYSAPIAPAAMVTPQTSLAQGGLSGDES